MKITIFGGTGATGLLLTQKALAAGHEVTVYARNPAKVTFAHAHLTVVRGALGDTAALAGAIAGRDAVISVLGPTGRTKGRPLTAGLSAIVAAMRASGVRRLIATSTPSATDPADRAAWSFRLAVWLVRTLMAEVYADIVASALIVRSSGLDWTLVRLPMLSHKEGVSPPVVGYVGDPEIRLFSLSRAVLADFLLAQLGEGALIRQAPVLSNRR